MRRLFLTILGVLLFALAFAPNEAQAACANPVGAAGAIIYNADLLSLQYCDNTNWIEMHTPGSGTGGCTNPTATVGSIIYNAADRVLQGCAGNQWLSMGPLGGMGQWKSVSASYSYSCGIKVDGTLWCWGTDGSGQLGNGAATDFQDSPVQESTAATDWIQVSAGETHACAVKANGTLWCWGSDSTGQLGNGATTGNQQSPVQESTSATNWASVDAGSEFTCAIKTTGTLWCWGDDTWGQIGNGATTGTQVSPVQEVTAATNWATVATGSDHTCSRKTTGAIYCWGRGFEGQIGDAGNSNRDTPVQESTAATNWASVTAGNFHTCAVKTTGTLWCWGNDDTGELGDGAPAGDQNVPVQESSTATNWASVSAGGMSTSNHTCAHKTDGTLWCWGDDGSGQVGNGTADTADQLSPVQESTSGTSWVAVSAGGFHSCGLTTSGAIWCWGSDAGLGNGDITGGRNSPVQLNVTGSWVSGGQGTYYMCAVKDDGTLWCWGGDSSGQLGNGATTESQNSPDQESTSATDWSYAAAGNSTACAIKTGGTLYCWGSDGSGQVGNGATTGNQESPVQESTAATNWGSVDVGINHACARKTTGAVFCWGSDSNGQIGNGATTGNQVSPVQESTAATNWGSSIAAGSLHSCAVKTTGTLWCWGSDGFGQIGNGATTGNQVSPVQESSGSTLWSQVSAFSNHTCAVRSNGTLWCWGSDSSGQIGNGATSSNQVSPVQESTSATNWASVSTGDSHTCAVKTNGTLWCWGSDSGGQLGNGQTSGTQESPVQEATGATDWDFAISGYQSTCAVKTNGSLWCWGSNALGELGLGIPFPDDPIKNIECVNPKGYEGSIIYNSDYAVMQYCDGVSWAAIGKAP
jgi:alpha-tubulin suppressor-like RCC1 family protein